MSDDRRRCDSDGTWADESDWELGAEGVDGRRSGGRVRAAAGRRGGRPAQRRQVHPGEPHPGPPRGRRAGHPRRHPRPGVLRRELAGPPVHRAGHRRLGARRQGPAAAGRRAGDASRCAPPTRSSWWSTRSSAPPAPTRPRPSGCRRSGKPVFLAANKVDNERGGVRGRRAVVAGAGAAAPGQRHARPRRGRPARRRARGAARGLGGGSGDAAVRGASRWSASPTSARARC